MNRIALISLLLGLCTLLYSQSDSARYIMGVNHAQKNEYLLAKPYLIYSASDSSSISMLEKGIANHHLRRVFWDENNFEAAFDHGNSSVEIFTQVNEHSWLGEALYALCMNNLIAGSYDIALMQAQKAFEAYEMVKDSTMMIKAMARRGIVFHDIGEYQEGIRICGEAQEIFNAYSGRNADLQAMIWGITAINYDDDGRSDKAVDLYRKILPLKDQLSSDREIIRTYNNIGNSLMKLGELDEAEKFFLLNLQANERDEFQYGIATVKTNLGTIAYKKGDFTKAKNLLDEAQSIAYEINDAEKILDVLEQKHFLYEQQNDPSSSLRYLKEYHLVKDSLYDLDKQRQIRFLETRFETQKKEQQIALQKVDLSEQKAQIERARYLALALVILVSAVLSLWLLNRNRLKKKQQLIIQQERLHIKEAEINASINSQEKERARYARDLHDGFGQMISILNINLGNLKENAKPEERLKVFEESEKVINEMYDELKSICFDLMPQTLVQNGLQSALQEFAARINKAGKVAIETNIFGLDQRLTEIQEISLYRITQEWINNILKYSDADKIIIQITKDEEEITLLIEDNGSGFDPAKLTDSKGNGWKNLNTRANLIQGELELETTMGRKGTSLIVNAPTFVATETASRENTILRV